MSASTSSTGPEPWGRCNKGCGPSLLSDMAATLYQQQSNKSTCSSDIPAIQRILHGFHLHAMVHSGLISDWMNACARFRGSAGVVLEHTATPRGATRHPRAAYRTPPQGAYRHPQGNISRTPREHASLCQCTVLHLGALWRNHAELEGLWSHLHESVSDTA